MWDMFYTIANNLGISFENIIVLIIFFLGIIWYAKGLKIGSMCNLISFAAIFVWFYEDNLAWHLPLVIFIIHLVILSLSLYGGNKTDIGVIG